MVKGIGQYPNAEAVGLSNDSISSIQVGDNVQAILCQAENYGGLCETLAGDDSDLNDNPVGNDNISSVSVEARSEVTVQEVWTTDHNGYTRPVFLPGDDIRYKARINNSGAYTLTVSVVWAASGPSEIMYRSENRNVPPGTSDIHLDDSVPTDTPIGTYTLQVTATYGGQTSTQTSTFAIHPDATCDIPSPTSPNSDRIRQTEDVVFFWSGYCAQYRVEYWGGPLEGSIRSEWLSNNSWNVGQQWNGRYCWHAQGRSSTDTETGWSNPPLCFTVVPDTPSGLTATVVSLSQIDVSWDDPGGDKDGYNVYYSDERFIGSTDSTSYSVAGLECNKEYSFHVKAYKSDIESDPSNTVNASTLPCGTTDRSGIEGWVFIDINGNGVHEPWQGETEGIPGVTINLYQSDQLLRSKETVLGTYGAWYGFGDLDSGTYTVEEVQPAGYTTTSPDTLVVTLAVDERKINQNFGEQVSTTDTTPPTGHITSPESGSATNSCPVTIEAEASDTGSGVDRVEFHVWHDGSWHHIGDDSITPFSKSWDCSIVSDQRIKFTIHILDKVGNEAIDPGGYVDVVLDRMPPTSSVSSLSSPLHSPSFIVSWSGEDPSPGFNPASYDVQYRDDANGSWLDWQVSVTRTQAVFTGQMGHTYYFRSRARDRAGNLENYPSGDGDAVTTLECTEPITVTTRPPTEFSTNEKVNDDRCGASQWPLAIASDSLGNMYAAWIDTREYYRGDVYSAKLAANSDTWGPNSRVNYREDTKAAVLIGPDVATDWAGNVYVAWSEDWSVYVAKSTDGGLSYGPSVKVAANLLWPSVAVDIDGNVHVVGHYGILEPVYYFRSTDGGASFTGPVQINDSTGGSFPLVPLSIAVDRNGVIHVVWDDYRNGGSPDIYYANSSDGGLSFTPNVKVNDSVGTEKSQTYPSLAVDNNGNIHVAWLDFRSGEADIYYAKSTDGGLSFSTNVKVNDVGAGTARYHDPTIAVDSQGHIHVVWVAKHGEIMGIFYAESADGGVSFRPSVRVNDDIGGAGKFASQVTVDSNDLVHVIWSDKRGGDLDIYHSTKLSPISTTEWRGEYYANPTLSGAPTLVRYDAILDFNWDPHESPGPGIPDDYFSVRWTRSVYFEEGRYRFTTTTDDGVRLYVDGNLLIDEWHVMAATSFSEEKDLSQGTHTVMMEYFEGNGKAVARLDWSYVVPPSPTPIPSPTRLPTIEPTPILISPTPTPTETPSFTPTPTTTATPTPPQLGQVQGMVFWDLDANGDYNPGELPLGGAIIRLFQGETVLTETTTGRPSKIRG